MTIRFVTGEFLDEYDPTIEDSYRKQMNITDNQSVLFDVLDTAGQEEFASMQDRWLREAQIPLLCFAINEKDALKTCIQDFERFLRIKDYAFDDDHFCRGSLALIACKMDLYYDNTEDDTDRHIMNENYRIAMALSKYWNCPFIETSSKQYININACFKQIIYEFWLQTQTKCIRMNSNDSWNVYENALKG